MELENLYQSTENSLVSIIVVTYNSAKYVLETLESAKAQTYKNIELIISDDCSTDDTVEICRSWITENKSRFTNTKLITFEENTGIPANFNRGLFAAQGEWVKFIAGDDLLLPDCVLQNIKFASNGPYLDILVSQKYIFECQNDKRIIKSISPTSPGELKLFELPACKQFEFLLTSSFNFASSVFFNKSIFEKIGCFDEKYKYIEDLPFWLKLTKAGIKLSFLAEPTVLYRLSDQSVSRIRGKFYQIDFFLSVRQMTVEQIFPFVPIYHILFWNKIAIEYLRFKILVTIFNNNRNKLSSIVARLFEYLIIEHSYQIIKDFLLSLFKSIVGTCQFCRRKLILLLN